MFAIDGVKLPANASKEKSGTHAELAHHADRLDKAAARIVALHQAQDEHGGAGLDVQRQARIDELRRQAQATREFLASHPKRVNRKGTELKTNITDPDSAKMATSKGVIQGYAAQAAVDSAHQVIVAAQIIGSGSEQAMLLPMIEQAAPVREARTLITADAGYFSDDNIKALRQDQGGHAMAALLPGAQHREDRHQGDAPGLKDRTARDPPCHTRIDAQGAFGVQFKPNSETQTARCKRRMNHPCIHAHIAAARRVDNRVNAQSR
jgi:Transposase DDE domain